MNEPGLARARPSTPSMSADDQRGMIRHLKTLLQMKPRSGVLVPQQEPYGT